GLVRAIAPLDPSALAVAAIGAAAALAAAQVGRSSATGFAILGMYYFGFVHFAAGYHFFARSAATRELARRTPLALPIRLGLCALASAPFSTRALAPIVYTSVFLHFAENALYLALKRAGRIEEDGGGILAVVVGLAGARLVGVLVHDPARLPLHASVAIAVL